jgi:hypothetical protein
MVLENIAQNSLEMALIWHVTVFYPVNRYELEKFFDTVNHDLVIKMVWETVKDET